MIKKLDMLRFRQGEMKPDLQVMGQLCYIGIPMGLQYSVTAIGSVILQMSVNSLGSDAIAAVTASSKVSMFFCCPFDALGTSMATYGGQNVGAKKTGQARFGDKGKHDGRMYLFSICTADTLFIW